MEEKAGNVTHLLVLFPFRYDGIYMRGTTSKMPQLIAGFGLLVIGLLNRGRAAIRYATPDLDESGTTLLGSISTLSSLLFGILSFWN